MSKDKGSKNQKKAPATKNSGKEKAVSTYKMEGKKGADKPGPLVSITKSNSKAAPNPKT